MAIGCNGRTVAAITGASSGFGSLFADRLAREGNDLLIIARRESKLAEVAKNIENSYGVEVEILVADLSKLDEVKRVEQRLLELPNLLYLINNAGFGGNQKFPDLDVEIETRMIQTHCLASMRLARAALVPMKAKNMKKGAGYIVNVASIAGFLAGKGAADYCGTKAYLISFSKCLQCDVAKYGVRVQALCPGFSNTEFHMTDTMINSDVKKIYPKFLWGRADYVVEHSLRDLKKTCRLNVVYIPKLFYKLVGYFGSNWLIAPLRVIFSKGNVR